MKMAVILDFRHTKAYEYALDKYLDDHHQEHLRIELEYRFR